MKWPNFYGVPSSNLRHILLTKKHPVFLLIIPPYNNQSWEIKISKIPLHVFDVLLLTTWLLQNNLGNCFRNRFQVAKWVCAMCNVHVWLLCSNLATFSEILPSWKMGGAKKDPKRSAWPLFSVFFVDYFPKNFGERTFPDHGGNPFELRVFGLQTIVRVFNSLS